MKRLNSFDENTTPLELLSTKNTINPSNNVNQMAMKLAHEVRNPLTTIKGFLQLLKPELKDEKKAEYIDIAVDEIDRVNQILNHYLNPFYIIKKENVSINSLVTSIFKLSESEAKMKNITMSLCLMNVDIHVLVNEHEVRQVLINLLKNAIEAIETSCKIHGNGLISIGTEVSEHHAYIHVIDNGCGISNENMEKLFTPFFTTKEEGTGIGLSLCKEIIDHNDGHLFVSMLQTGGTQFTIELPLQK
jgi:signal transduction histidine kinase